MQITVGSKNKAKIAAVTEAIADYAVLKDASIEDIEASSQVSDQPLSLEETVTGAINRAKESLAQNNTSYGFGIESGLIHVSQAQSGHMDVTVCAIADADDVYIGISSAWEFPDPKVSEAMTDDGLDMAQACLKFGLTDDPNIGQKGGAISIVTNGRLDRKGYTKEAIRNALIHIEYKIKKTEKHT